MTGKNRRVGYAITSLVALMALPACGNGDAQQKSSDNSVVRLAELKTSGDISGDFRPLDISSAKFQGSCSDDVFANFGLVYEDKSWRKVGVTVMTKDAIASSQVGAIGLDWALVSFMDNEYNATQFRGPADFVISTNDASAPRMAGTVKGTLPGYSGMLEGKVLSDKSIDFEFTFEIVIACGATG